MQDAVTNFKLVIYTAPQGKGNFPAASKALGRDRQGLHYFATATTVQFPIVPQTIPRQPGNSPFSYGS